ncbi:Gfo/Idh/MocA family protein [Salimicrobium halophilum]|uniref:Predicted dehydrogenase n=1 Tax=Salimicrobium halophilum TaxID=86666 RepID=A0A1G8SU87_9BACI|nr:Gfo/Idh/MocA family oxidoreductase [Salimicrobium halophilum]SDJ32744.1 Predicted dehydrogenase [Salimicrobium halophilum]
MSKLKIGVIGTGGIAIQRHIPALRSLEDKVELVAVQDVNKERAEEVAGRFAIPEVCESPDELFGLVDAVIICTPNKFHENLSVHALNKGVHVLCEKPMAMNAVEASSMLEASEKNGRTLAIAYHYRHMEEGRMAKKVTEAGEVGKPLVARVQAMRRRKVPGWGVFTNKELQGGGSLIDFGCHLLDLSLWLLGNPKPVEVSAQTYNDLSRIPGQVNDWGTFDHETFEVDDHVTSYIRFENGLSLQFECSWAANIKEDHTTVTLSGVDGGLSVFPFELYQTKHGAVWDASPVLKDEEEVEIGVKQLSNFIGSCLGEEELVVDPAEALRVTAIIDAMYESSQSGRAVRLDG